MLFSKRENLLSSFQISSHASRIAAILRGGEASAHGFIGMMLCHPQGPCITASVWICLLANSREFVEVNSRKCHEHPFRPLGKFMFVVLQNIMKRITNQSFQSSDSGIWVKHHWKKKRLLLKGEIYCRQATHARIYR